MNVLDNSIVASLLPSKPLLIMLFGSYAQGCNREASDMVPDLKEMSNTDRWEIQESLAIKLNADVDLVDMSKANDVLNFQIVSTGRLLYAADRAKAEAYMDRVYLTYLQLNQDRKEVLAYAAR